MQTKHIFKDKSFKLQIGQKSDRPNLPGLLVRKKELGNTVEIKNKEVKKHGWAKKLGNSFCHKPLGWVFLGGPT